MCFLQVIFDAVNKVNDISVYYICISGRGR